MKYLEPEDVREMVRSLAPNFDASPENLRIGLDEESPDGEVNAAAGREVHKITKESRYYLELSKQLIYDYSTNPLGFLSIIAHEVGHLVSREKLSNFVYEALPPLEQETMADRWAFRILHEKAYPLEPIYNYWKAIIAEDYEDTYHPHISDRLKMMESIFTGKGGV